MLVARKSLGLSGEWGSFGCVGLSRVCVCVCVCVGGTGCECVYGVSGVLSEGREFSFRVWEFAKVGVGVLF